VEPRAEGAKIVLSSCVGRLEEREACVMPSTKEVRLNCEAVSSFSNPSQDLSMAIWRTRGIIGCEDRD